MTIDKWINTAIEVLKIIIWPGIVLIVLKKFETEVKALIGRIQSVSAAGVTVNTANQQKEAIEDNEKIKNLAEEIKTQRDITTKLVELQENTKKSKDLFELLYHFEKSYRLIFGSQLDFLLILEGKANSISREIAEALYRRTQWATTGYPFESYIGFLENSYFVNFNQRISIYEISPLGELFLGYLRQNNISLQKVPY